MSDYDFPDTTQHEAGTFGDIAWRVSRNTWKDGRDMMVHEMWPKGRYMRIPVWISEPPAPKCEVAEGFQTVELKPEGGDQ
ncbi:hypothetical protein [Hoyosella altamirensis]|uniref:hypothetical protein n=1 Tax=Hoyosella altamirensis TaxID=616997 RepID=UPI0007DB117A|nr:hypothetical protein [Hoyosella altamirensis]